MTKLRRQPFSPLPPQAAKAFYPPLGVNLKATPSGRGCLLFLLNFSKRESNLCVWCLKGKIWHHGSYPRFSGFILNEERERLSLFFVLNAETPIALTSIGLFLLPRFQLFDISGFPSYFCL